MSVHYTMDWLTLFKAKEVLTMRQNLEIAQAQGRPVDKNIGDTAHFINRAMALVMDNKALLYGVRDRATDELAGTFGFYGFSTDGKCATVRMATLPETPLTVEEEVLPRMLGFAVHELGLSRLVAGQIVRDADRQLYLQHHFTPRSDGTLVLNAADIADLAAYKF
jgi:hypothetical protein